MRSVLAAFGTEFFHGQFFFDFSNIPAGVIIFAGAHFAFETD